MQASHFCKSCRKPTNLKQHDFGYGPGEAQGRRYNHTDIRTVTTCCESEDFFDSERECREDLQLDLSDTLNNGDTLSLSALETIEKIIAAHKQQAQLPAVKPLLPPPSQHTIDLVELARSICLAPFQKVTE